MGWTNSHLHCFRIAGRTFSSRSGTTDFDESGDENEDEVILGAICRGPMTKFVYEYDFGDGWEHELVVEKILEPEDGVRYPRCLAGKRACPPEDCGGVWGYADLLAALADPTHEMHEEKKEWFGDEWDAEAFDLRQTNKHLASLAL
jgi:hypothetical protein